MMFKKLRGSIKLIKINNNPIIPFIQTFLSIMAIGIALYGLYNNQVRDIQSNFRYNLTVKRDSIQQKKTETYINNMISILHKYDTSQILTLEQLKQQSITVSLQYQNQLIISEPNILPKFTVQDTLKASGLI